MNHQTPPLIAVPLDLSDEAVLFLRLVDDGFPGLFRVKVARISHADSSLPEGREAGGASDGRRRVHP